MIEGFGVCLRVCVFVCACVCVCGGVIHLYSQCLSSLYVTKPITPRHSGKIGSLYKQQPAIIDTTFVCECMSDTARGSVEKEK